MRYLSSTSLGILISMTLSGVVAEDQPTPAASDKTGTNPLNFQRTLQAKNEYNRIDDNFANITRAVYSEPLLPQWKIGLEVPVLASDLSGSEEFGLSDMVVKTSWIPYANTSVGVSLGFDVIMPTATNDALGADKWQIAPSLTVAFMLPENLIFAPAYKHTASAAGNEERADISTGTVDFYLVWKFDHGRQWLVLDPTFLLDYENDRYHAATTRTTYGRLLGKVGNAMSSCFIKPGIGIGSERPNDWSLEVGVSLIGF